MTTGKNLAHLIEANLISESGMAIFKQQAAIEMHEAGFKPWGSYSTIFFQDDKLTLPGQKIEPNDLIKIYEIEPTKVNYWEITRNQVGKFDRYLSLREETFSPLETTINYGANLFGNIVAIGVLVYLLAPLANDIIHGTPYLENLRSWGYLIEQNTGIEPSTAVLGLTFLSIVASAGYGILQGVITAYRKADQSNLNTKFKPKKTGPEALPSYQPASV